MRLLFIIIIALATPVAALDWSFVGAGDVDGLCLEYEVMGRRLFVGTSEGFRYYEVVTDTWVDFEWDGYIGRAVHSILPFHTAEGRIVTGRENAWFKGYIELMRGLGGEEEIIYESDGGSVTGLCCEFGSLERIYACTWSDVVDGELLRSVDYGESWQLLGHPQHAMTDIVCDPDMVLYLGGSSQVMKSLDHGESWVEASDGLPAMQGVYCLMADPGSGGIVTGGHVLASVDDGVFESWDHAESWTQISDWCARQISDRKIVGFESDAIAAVTFDGRVMLWHGGTIWEDITSNLPSAPVEVAFCSHDRRFYVITAQSGLWRSDMLTAAPSLPFDADMRAWPNPFNPRTSIHFRTSSDRRVTVRIFDSTGREVARPLDSFLQAGDHELSWDAAGLPSGLYLARVSGLAESLKLLLLK